MDALRIIAVFTLGFITPFAILGVFTFLDMFDNYWGKR